MGVAARLTDVQIAERLHCGYCGRPCVPGRFTARLGDKNYAHVQCHKRAVGSRGLRLGEPDARELAEIESAKAAIRAAKEAALADTLTGSTHYVGPGVGRRGFSFDRLDTPDTTAELVKQMAGVRRRLKLRALPPVAPQLRPQLPKESEPVKDQHDTSNGTTANRFGVCPVCGTMRSHYNGRCFTCKPGPGKRALAAAPEPVRLPALAPAAPSREPVPLAGARRELAALSQLVEVLDDLDDSARRRAIAFVMAYYVEGN